ncbi:salt stress protein, Slr1339 family [Roseofilum casamattae]|uniref:ATPase n=1 Tax=Roseofilum casamattae BLCC-M143 TaxID=3022442 RepID=A0ABT7C284_9CYAN|nr:hypothetical protein [Roseofilum casamattae]MDJ1185564.1 hypothetical protein [Roseofilum casamattae BLCC-M143]
MSSIDDLLNELRAGHQEKGHESGDNPPASSAPGNTADNTDNLLDDLRSQFTSQPTPSPAPETDLDAIKQQFRPQATPPSPEADSSLDELKQRYQQNQEQAKTQSKGVNPDLEQVRLKAVQLRSQREAENVAAEQTDDILSNMRDRFIQDRAVARQKAEAAKEEERQRQEQRRALKPRARKWLEELDPYSDEGYWFDQFAQSYSDRLEAALDYLQAMGDR